jgi:hypothetical protein
MPAAPTPAEGQNQGAEGVVQQYSQLSQDISKRLAAAADEEYKAITVIRQRRRLMSPAPKKAKTGLSNGGSVRQSLSSITS